MNIQRFVYLLLLAVPSPLLADFAVDNPLDFGEIVVRSNNGVSTVSISRAGTQLSTNHILILTPGSPAVFTLSGLAPYTIANLSVDLPAFSMMAYPGTAQFAITAVDLPASVSLGPSGSVQFRMGGTLSTSGNPAENYYSGAPYQIFLNLNIDY